LTEVVVLVLAVTVLELAAVLGEVHVLAGVLVLVGRSDSQTNLLSPLQLTSFQVAVVPLILTQSCLSLLAGSGCPLTQGSYEPKAVP